MTRIISWLLNGVYVAMLTIALPLVVWQSVRTGKYREGFREKFLGLVPRRAGSTPCAWIHAVSVGEVNLIATLLGALRAKHADWDFVISTTSRAGYELARKKYADHTVFYCPLDFSWAVRNAMRRVRPTLLVLTELELWPNLIASARDSGAPVAIVNGRLSDHSFPGYRRVRPFVAWMLRKIDLVAAQNEETAARFRALGASPDRVQVTGSLKYDGAQTDRGNARTQSLRVLSGIDDREVVFLAGSTQEPEEQIAIDIYRRLASQHPHLRLILVPRHPERFDAVAALLQASGLPWRRRSELSTASEVASRGTQLISSPPAESSHKPVMLVDTIGELCAWWGMTKIAFVGGSFGSRGGQNMIEPAAYGAAVSFGPNTRNFRDIVAAMLQADAAVVVHDDRELESFVRRCLEQPEYVAELGRRAQSLVQSQLGATQRTVTLLDAFFNAADVRKTASRTAA